MSDTNSHTESGQTKSVVEQEKSESISTISGMYKDWFLDYASYVILDRAIPYLEDGLKPVQRRILYAMRQMEDGRYNKVANIIGQTMQYHPHGDAAIGDALINLGQKDLLIDIQGNWGNILTGDEAAASRYIEARLSKFALDVVFNPDTTLWQMSYDGRKPEPITLPVKFPLVLAQGVEGIAVGLSTKILPHNFCELCEASIDYLRGEDFCLYPDFPTGGLIDVENYNDGERGSRVRIRARITVRDKKTLVISEIPYSTTTASVIDSIIKANDKGKIKIKQVEDNTAREVEIIIHLAPGVNPDLTLDALYAFTDCEVSVAPNCCIIIHNRPVFTDVVTVLKESTDKTVGLLKRELEIRKGEIEDKLHFASLEKIFIENRIYRDIEEEETWKGVLNAIDRGLDPFKIILFREVTEEDLVRLTEIKIKRISKFDSFKADEAMKKLEEELEEVHYNLKHLIDYAISHFENLLKKFGKDKGRKTEIRLFDSVQRSVVAVANRKLYVNREGGFIGYGNILKKEEFVCDCSDIDDIIVFLNDGTMKVTQADEKTFVGKNIIYVDVWKKNDDRTTYHCIYEDPKDKRSYIKRFQVTAITRDREYILTKSNQKGKVHYFTANPNGESETVTIFLKSKPRLRKTQFDYDFADLRIVGRDASGNVLTKEEIRKVVQKSQGVSTLGGREIWFDDVLFRLNADGVGTYLGNFEGDDRILVLYDDGSYELTTFDLTNRYDGKGKALEVVKLTPETVVTAIYYDADKKSHFVKRFQIETTTIEQKFSYISESKGSALKFATTDRQAVVKLYFFGNRRKLQQIDLEEFIDIKGWKAIGNKVTDDKLKSIKLISSVHPAELLQNKNENESELSAEEDDPGEQ